MHSDFIRQPVSVRRRQQDRARRGLRGAEPCGARLAGAHPARVLAPVSGSDADLSVNFLGNGSPRRAFLLPSCSAVKGQFLRIEEAVPKSLNPDCWGKRTHTRGSWVAFKAELPRVLTTAPHLDGAPRSPHWPLLCATRCLKAATGHFIFLSQSHRLQSP